MPSVNKCPRPGQSLVEFAMIALFLYLLLAATMEIGRAVFAAQVVQQAADVMARELARMPLPAVVDAGNGGKRGFTFEDALKDANVRSRIYDKGKLVINLDTLTEDLDDHFASLPLVNQQLRSVMIFETVNGVRYLRYPGALLKDSDGNNPTGMTVAVPIVKSRGEDGTETVEWVEVVQEVKGPNDPSPFAFTSSQRGLIAVRIHYPFQAAALTGQMATNGTFEPGTDIRANDGSVGGADPPAGTSLRDDDPNEVGPYAGSRGLGRLLARGTTLRPFRRVLSMQSLARRELAQ